MQSILDKAREMLKKQLEIANIDFDTQVKIKVLSPQEAVGEDSSDQLAINRGPERVIEAEINGEKGQAFTDVPVDWQGKLNDIFSFNLDIIRHRAHFAATLNAACKLLGVCDGVIHCRDEDPEKCGEKMADKIEKDFYKPVIAMFGLQPFIAKALVKRFGKDNILIGDLNPANIGQIKQGIKVYHGQNDAQYLVDNCTIALITGSSVVNNTIDETLKLFEEKQKPYLLFGNTIAGVASLLKLNHFCPLSI